MSMYDIISMLDYVALAAVAFWGAFNLIMVWGRVGQKRFKSEEAQQAFLESIEPSLIAGDFDTVEAACEGNSKAVPMMISLAMLNRDLGYTKVRQLIMDRFQRDVLADMEYRLSWVTTVIKSAPMLGLLGTVMGMMGAFGTLATAANVEASMLAADINVALQTTAIGLSIAIPLVIGMAAVNNRIRQMEELVAAGLTRFLEGLKQGYTQSPGAERQSA